MVAMPSLVVGAQPASHDTSSASQASAGAFHQMTRAPAASTPYLVLIVLDGARPDYFNIPGIPHVRQLIRNGTQYTNAWAGILESETPSGHASITSGSDPSADGILSFDWANSDNLPVNLFDPGVIRAGAMEKIMRRAGAPSIASIVHKKDRTAKVVALSGHKYYAADALGGPDADVIMYYTGTSQGRYVPTSIPGHVPPKGVLSAPGLTTKNSNIPVGLEDHLTMKLAVSTFERMRQRATLINLPEFDWPLGHVAGGDRDPSMVRTLMRGFDQDLAMLENAYREAGVLDQTLFVLTADHGFAPIYHTVSQSLFAKAVSAAGTSIVSDTYHTGAFLWLRNRSRAVVAANNVARLHNPYIQAVYYKAWTAKGGFQYVRATTPTWRAYAIRPYGAPGMEAANQYLLRSFNGPNGPDLVVQFTEEAASEPGGQTQWKGDHGGGDWQSQHLPLIFSGPEIRHGYVSSYPARLIDIAPTVLSVLGVPATGMQGIPLADALESASPRAWAAQRAEGATLHPIVSALQQESRLEAGAK